MVININFNKSFGKIILLESIHLPHQKEVTPWYVDEMKTWAMYYFSVKILQIVG